MTKQKQEIPTKKIKTAYIYIPIDPLNPSEKTVTVSINGRGWTIARGFGVQVPLDVAKILYDEKYINSYKEL